MTPPSTVHNELLGWAIRLASGILFCVRHFQEISTFREWRFVLLAQKKKIWRTRDAFIFFRRADILPGVLRGDDVSVESADENSDCIQAIEHGLRREENDELLQARETVL